MCLAGGSYKHEMQPRIMAWPPERAEDLWIVWDCVREEPKVTGWNMRGNEGGNVRESKTMAGFQGQTTKFVQGVW